MIEQNIIRSARSFLLTSVLQRNRTEYIDIVSFMGARIPRGDLPNLQNIPLTNLQSKKSAQILSTIDINSAVPLVEDCTLPKVIYKESLLDKFLLATFRSLVQKEINFVSPTEGILGNLNIE